nr:hypothetical protein [Tanacetum cinerariifolium]
MTSITAQQTKLDHELVLKENRLNIGKCNGRIPRGLKPKEETFQVALDTLVLTPCYLAFVITVEVYMHQIEDQDFDALPSEEDTISFLRELGHTGLSIHSMIKEASKKYGAVLPECLTSPQMKESKAYKTCLGYATGTITLKVAKKFKKASPSKKDSVPGPANEEPVQKGKRVKRYAKKSSSSPTTGIVIRELPMETQSKRKEKVDVARGVPDVTIDDSTKSESESCVNDDEDSNDEEGNEQENDSEERESDSEQDTDRSELDSEFDQQDDDDDDEVKYDDEDDDNDDDQFEGDEDRGMDSDDVQDKKADVGMTDA